MCSACSHADLWVLNKTYNGQADTHSKVNTMRASSSSCMVNAWCQVEETDGEQDLIIRCMLSLAIYHMCPSCQLSRTSNILMLSRPLAEGKLVPHTHTHTRTHLQYKSAQTQSQVRKQTLPPQQAGIHEQMMLIRGETISQSTLIMSDYWAEIRHFPLWGGAAFFCFISL